MSIPGNPAGLPGYDAPGEEWFASTQELGAATPADPKPPMRDTTVVLIVAGAMLMYLALKVAVDALTG